jgi:S-formylglutathione hydrolase
VSPLKFIAVAMLALFIARPAFALDGKLVDAVVPTKNLAAPVPITFYLPKNYDPKRATPYPLVIQLHGGGGSNQQMHGLGGGVGMGGLFEEAIDKGLIPPAVSVMPSAGRSLYMNYRDGSQKWEAFITDDLLPYMRKNFNVVQGRQGTFITGISMGGMGSLRIAFKHPELFQAVASQEPGIEPALAFDDIKLRDRFWRSDELFEQIFGKPVDKAYWAQNNPATIASKDPQRLLGLGIYLEAGDQDMFYLDQGTEFLHRVLFDAGVGHEYRLVKGADHVGASLPPRFLDAMGFIGRQIDPPLWIDATALRTRKVLDGMKQRMGYPVTPFDPNRIHAQ